MKNIKITFALLVLLSISSCDDSLSEIPDNRTQLDTPEKISELLVNAYPGASYMDLGETMSDNVGDGEIGSVILKNQQSYNWEMQTETDIDSEAQYWDACYSAIAHANQALAAIEKLGAPVSLNPQKAEALLARAYSHFMLVSFWSQRYNPATSATDLGIPYITEPETQLLKKYTRNSVKEVFDFIEQDIEEGLKYVSNDYKEPKFHFNKVAAKAFASRFYLIKGDWDKVLEVTQDIESKPVGKLKDYVTLSSLAPQIQFIEYGKSSQAANLLIVSSNSTNFRSYYQNNFYLTPSKEQELFGNTTNPFNKSWLYNASYSYNSGKTCFAPKFWEYFVYTNLTAQIGNTYTGIVLLSYDEFYLNRIEALIMKGRITEANTELEYFLATRTREYDPSVKLTEEVITKNYPVIADELTPYYAMTPLQTSYVKAISEARRRDFVHEGLRWLDVKRFNIVVNHTAYGKPVNTLVKDDKRRALQIPLSASNHGIEKNPR